MHLRSLSTRIVVFFGGLVLVLACGAMGTIMLFASKTADTQVANELAVGERVFARIVADKTEQLAQAAAVLAADFAFREAVASGDHETLVSALDNHGRRIHADLMMMVDLNGKLTASTGARVAHGSGFPYQALLLQARQRGRASGIIVTAQAQYQMVVVAVRAPVIVGWVAMGFKVDDKLANEAGALTGLQVSFLSTFQGGPWHLTGSTLSAPVRAASMSELVSLLGTHPTRPHAPLVGTTNVTSLAILSATPESSAVAVLQRPLAEAQRTARHLQFFLLAMTALGLATALLGSIFIARGITTPLRKLSVIARTISGGDYTVAAEATAHDEVGALAQALNQMREAIAARESTITDLAYRDALTQLPNRALFNDRLQQAVAAARREGGAVSVLLLDLDDFQIINTTLGHQNGDLLLQAVARRLQVALTRKSDTLARLGGDEFAILLPNVDSASARRSAVRILAALEPALQIVGHTVDVAGSIGLVAFPEHGDDAPTLMSRVDLSMTVAKRTKSGFAEYSPSYDQSPERLSLLSELRTAVENQQLILFYQPKIDVASGRAVQVEALIRWQHPVRGFVPPDEFIPFAEQTGYIRTISQWVIGTACAQLAEWHRRGIVLGVCINISARDLLNNELPNYIAECMRQHQLAPDTVWLEITESAIMDDPIRAQDNLQRLHALGLKLSIDDFGTGYSSLAYLKRLPVDELKIDKAFVLNMDKDEDDAIIVRSTIELGHNMGLKVVAEGVDHVETLQLLQTWGCDIAQGYYISRPLPVDKLESWLNAPPWQTVSATPVLAARG